jgi:hypothetical protein
MTMRSTHSNHFTIKRKLDLKCFNIPISCILTDLQMLYSKYFYFPLYLHFFIRHMITFAAVYVKLRNKNIK